MRKYPSYCCQKCGACIGWLGRLIHFLLPFLTCEIHKEEVDHYIKDE